MKEKKIAIVLTILAIVITIIGSTFAYFTWATNASQNTTVTFTVASNYSCSANGGGNITSNDKMLTPIRLAMALPMMLPMFLQTRTA